jgi:hypothetical protein
MAKKPPNETQSKQGPRESWSRTEGNRRAVGNRPTRYEDPDSTAQKAGGDLREKDSARKPGYGTYGELPKKPV